MTITDNSTSLIEQVKLKAAEVTKSFLIDMWLAKVTPDKVMPILHSVIDAAREQYADAVKHGDGIYAVGYCVGGRFVLLLGKDTATDNGADEEAGDVRKGPFIRAGAVAHAASVTPEDFEDIKVPISLVCVEDDPLFPSDIRTAGEDTMSSANLEHEVQVYPGVPHGKSFESHVLLCKLHPLTMMCYIGFAVVGSYESQDIQDAQSTAYEQMLNWIKNH